MKKDFQSCGTCAAVLLCVTATSVIITPKAHLLAEMFEKKPAVAPEPIDQETIEGIGRYLGSDLEPWRRTAAEWPPLAEVLLADGPTCVIEFDLRSGDVKHFVTLLDASARTHAADVDAIAQSIYDGHVAEANGNGYILGHLYPKYLNANYPAADPQPVQ